jgi:hypothetical protein
MEHSKMSVKQLKAFVKMYKKVHKTPFSKMKKPELVALAERVSKGEVHHKKEAPEHAPEHHAAPKAARAATDKQKAHRALFGAWVKAKTGKPFSEFKEGHHSAAPAPKKEKKAKAEPKAEHKAPKAPKDLGAKPSPAPKMKVEVIQKAVDKELVDSMGGKAKAKKFVVAKELTEAMGGKKMKEPKNQ